jgi:RNA-directed DNA polymerase
VFDKLRSYAKLRIALLLAKRHGRPHSFGWAVVFESADSVGLIRPDGCVVAPRPHQDRREKPNAFR